MQGITDELDLAFLTVDFGQGPIDFQVDTAFRGTLLIGEDVFDSSRAEPAGFVDADLAADQSYEFPRFRIIFQWLGQAIDTFILVGPGKECLLGTALLSPHHLDIDCEARVVHLTPNPNW